jgi:uncharacterized protein (TIGR02118 family)
MIRLSVMYPNTEGTTFDWNYYLGPHVVLARKLLLPLGLVRLEIDRAIGTFPPEAPTPYYAVGHLFFPTLQVLQDALALTSAQLIADQSNYYSATSVVQISEVIEAA